MKNKYILEGLSCSNCAIKIERSVQALEEVKDANLNFATKTLYVTSNEEKLPEIKKIVKSIEPHVQVLQKEEEAHGEKRWNLLIILGILCYIGAFFVPDFLKLYLYLTAYVLIGYPVIIAAIRNIIHFKPLDENFLMFIATVGAFTIGEFPEGVAVMLFYYIGEYFQDKAVDSSRKHISDLMNIKPEYANLLTENGEIKRDPQQIKVNDLIVVKAGERIPLDGVVIEGEGSIDVKSLTGESMPIEVAKGSKVLSGSINLNGLLKIKVESVYADSTVAKILDLIENSSNKKAKAENFITKFAKIYTPIVVLSALALSVIPPLFLGWDTFSQWLYKGLVFLVVSCPCALVISVPLGFFGGIGSGSKRGILIKGSNYLDALNHVEKAVFDKTGTLTKGEFEVFGIYPIEKITKEKLIELSAYAESNSNHPVAFSILKKFDAEIEQERITEYREVSGHGVKLMLDGKELMVGNAKLMEENRIPYPDVETLNTIVFVAYNKEYLGYLEVSDVEKEDSKDTIDTLNQMGIETIMLTGDKKTVADRIGEKLNLKKIYSELLPQKKVEILEQLKSESKGSILFVGDGINDAPALKLADVGISMGGMGSDAAIEASDIVLMKDAPSLIVTAIQIAKRTRKIVTQNIFMALTVKLLFLALALFGLSNMWGAVFADVGVSLIAVLNSMRTLK